MFRYKALIKLGTHKKEVYIQASDTLDAKAYLMGRYYAWEIVEIKCETFVSADNVIRVDFQRKLKIA